MKRVLLSVLSVFSITCGFSQNIGINATGATPDASAILDVSSTTKGMLIPRMTTANRTAITTPATGLVVYDTNLNSFYYYNGTAWIWLLSSNNGWSTIGNAGTTAGTNFIGTTDAVDFVTKTSNTEVMRVTSGGNVGIGTATPNALLQLGNTLSNRKLVLWEDANNDHQIYGFGINNFMLRYQVASTSADHAFYAATNSTTSNELMRIKGNGNVGIGTSTPTSLLDINDAGSNPRMRFRLNNSGTGFTLGYNNSVPEAYVWNELNTRMVFGTNNAYAMVIEAGGNVGIGTVTPSAKLDVVGKIYSTGANAECSAQDRTNGTQYTMYGTGGVMRLWRGDFGDIIGMTNAGDVGINTTTPANKLHVNSATNTSYVQTSNANTGATAADGAVFGLFNNNAYLYNRENADLYFGTNNTRRMTITAGGNVGIGTAVITPAVPLAVGGVGSNVYATDIWAENNIHVQGNEGMLPGGRGRLRVGTAWNYVGIFSEATSTGANNDLVLGASSTWVRIGPNGGGQNLYISNGQLSLGADNAWKPGTSTWIISSDERLKTINGSYTKGLADIIKLNTITYKYKNVGEKNFDEKVLATTQVGFSAQEVQKIFPEAVGVGEDGYLNLNMHAILVAYVNAIKELDAKNKEQEKINNDLKQRLEKLEALLEKTK